MILRSTNDNEREGKQAKLFELKLRGGRSNKYTPDADIELGDQAYSFELKTLAHKGNGVSTARGVKQKKVDEWRGVSFWIFSEYEPPNELTGEHWILSASEMESFFVGVEEKLHVGSKTLAGLNDWAAAVAVLEGTGFDKELLKKLDYAFVDKGCALNDPKIPLHYVRENGTKIQRKEDLRRYLKKLLDKQ